VPLAVAQLEAWLQHDTRSLLHTHRRAKSGAKGTGSSISESDVTKELVNVLEGASHLDAYIAPEALAIGAALPQNSRFDRKEVIGA
jgi:hypothetical protein